MKQGLSQREGNAENEAEGNKVNYWALLTSTYHSKLLAVLKL